MTLLPLSSRPASAYPEPGYCTRITVTACCRIRTLSIREDLLVVVRQGRKTLISATDSLQAGRGKGLLMSRSTQWDVINDPAGAPRYEALVLAFADDLVRELEPTLPAQAIDTPPASPLPMDEELEEAVQRAAAFLHSRSMSVALRRHRLMEVLLLLSERGHRFKSIQCQGWEERIRRLITQHPQADWTVVTLARHFGTSASTLRRRLEGSGATLAALVREVRLETALTLLQSTRHSIGEIAARCGWESHSRFSAAFQERWGFAPSVMRQQLTQIG
ncbi:helix-turn-helix domain-containing protein [Comamonadaceae bacterium PP-2]